LKGIFSFFFVESCDFTSVASDNFYIEVKNIKTFHPIKKIFPIAFFKNDCIFAAQKMKK